MQYSSWLHKKFTKQSSMSPALRRSVSSLRIMSLHKSSLDNLDKLGLHQFFGGRRGGTSSMTFKLHFLCPDHQSTYNIDLSNTIIKCKYCIPN